MEYLSLDEIKCNLVPSTELQSKIEEIASSILEQGLIHPITVQPLNTSPASYEVITGKKRYLACRHLVSQGKDFNRILCDMKEGFDNLQKEEYALHENLKRGHLPWFEEVALVKRLHELRQKQHGTSAAHRPETGVKKGWGMRDTAAELGRALGSVSIDLQLARMVEINPALKNIKDKATATKVINQTVKRLEAEEMQAWSGSADCTDEIYWGDASSILNNLQELIFDFCITDPPWIKFEKSDDATLKRDDDTLPVFKALYRCMKWDSSLYLFCGADDFFFYRNELPKIGWKVQGHPCIWEKEGFMSRTGMAPWQHGRDSELILVAAKGSPVLASNTQVSSIFIHAVVPSKLLIHPNEKPVGLLELIAQHCSYEGSLGVDPFGGSGSFAMMCLKMRRHYTVIEREKDRYQKILDRIAKRKK